MAELEYVNRDFSVFSLGRYWSLRVGLLQRSVRGISGRALGKYPFGYVVIFLCQKSPQRL